MLYGTSINPSHHRNVFEEIQNPIFRGFKKSFLARGSLNPATLAAAEFH